VLSLHWIGWKHWGRSERWIRAIAIQRPEEGDELTTL
jgi:hypothetical protein